MSTCNCTPDLKQKVRHLKYQHILDAAVTAASRVGFHHVTRLDIALEAKVSPPLVSLYLGDMDSIRRVILDAAVTRRMLGLIAQGLAAQHPVAMEAPAELRAEAVASLA
jgi:AcrR family transcriptional regulator